MTVVDSSVWIDFLRGTDSPQRRELHRMIADCEDLAITGIILTEVLQGISDERAFGATERLLREFPVLTPSASRTFVHAARIYRRCRRQGRTVRKTADCIIAAICIENGSSLLHRDSDFDLLEACTPLRCHQV